MINTLQVDRLARITAAPIQWLILSHRTASPHALYDVLVLDGGRGKTMSDLVDCDRELHVNWAKLNKAKLNVSNSDKVLVKVPKQTQEMLETPVTTYIKLLCLVHLRGEANTVWDWLQI